jgi:hypothetical protein
VLKRLQGISPAINERNGFDLPPIKNEDDWKYLIQRCFQSAHDLAEAVKKIPEEKLSELTITEHSTHYKALHGVAEHAHYHLGQIVLLKKLVKSSCSAICSKQQFMSDEQVQQEIIQIISEDLSTQTSLTVFKEKLSAYINDLINHDFEKLIHVLYRLDVSEKKLKSTLVSSSSNAGMLIAEMIIERQVQKIKTREQFRQQNSNFSDEEKW